MLLCVKVTWISVRLRLTATFPPPGTTLASSHTATPAMPSPPWRMDTPCAGRTSLGSSCALVGRSSSANHITQTWVRASPSLKPPPQSAFLSLQHLVRRVCVRGRNASDTERRAGKSYDMKGGGAMCRETLVTAPCLPECVHQALAVVRAARVQGVSQWTWQK